MFEHSVEPHLYSDPWNLPFPDRLAALRGSKYRVAYFYEQANNSTFRYRSYNPTQVFNRLPHSETRSSYFFSVDRPLFKSIEERSDCLVICRSQYDDSLNALISVFRNANKPIFFDIDDLVFDVRFAHQVINALDQDKSKDEIWRDWFARISRVGYSLSFCDRVITTNRFLAGQIEKYTGKAVSVVPNFINNEQETISGKIYTQKLQDGFKRNGIVSIGYFSGSPSHRKDFALATPAIVKIMQERKNIELVVAGYIEAGSEFDTVRDRIRYIPFTDYVNLQREMAKVELNIVPLQDTIFSNCKSELKYFEAAVVGTLTIASPTFTYRNAIEDGKNGYLAHAHEWYEKISLAIDKLSDYPEMAQVARDHSLKYYSWQNQYSTLQNAVHHRD